MAVVVSVLLNVMLINSSIIKTERLNQSWYNLTINYANSIHFANITSIGREADILSQYDSLKHIQSQLFELQLLPEGASIVEGSTIMKSESLLKKQFSILGKMQQELKQSNKISDSTDQKYKQVS